MTIMNKLKKNRKKIIKTAVRYGAKNLRVFGSTVKNTTHAQSDIDFLVEFHKGTSLLKHAKLSMELESILGRPVDVVTSRSLRPRLRDQILNEAIPL